MSNSYGLRILQRLRDLILGDDLEPGWLSLLKWGSLGEFILLALFVGYSVKDGSVGGALVLAGGMYVCGALLGFLFGHPRWIEVAATGAGYVRKSKPNTNLEKVSDWLTTLIVGLTLVKFDSVLARLHSFCKFIAPSVAPVEESGVELATGIVVLFAVTGFLLGYLYTRLKLQDDFDRDRLAEEPAYLEGVMNAYLYRDPPESFRKTLSAAAEFEVKFPETGNYRVYLQVAIAHAQEFQFRTNRAAQVQDPAKQGEDLQKAKGAQTKCLEALAEAYAREPDCIEFLHLMWEPMLAPATENDLAVFRNEAAFKSFFQDRLPPQRLKTLESMNVRQPKAP